MATEITEPTIAIIPERAPVVGMNAFAVGAFFCRAEPQIPIDIRRLWFWLKGRARPRSLFPNVCFLDRTNDSAIHQFHDAAVIIASVDLRSHLSDDVILFGQVAQYAHLMDRVSQG